MFGLLTVLLLRKKDPEDVWGAEVCSWLPSTSQQTWLPSLCKITLVQHHNQPTVTPSTRTVSSARGRRSKCRLYTRCFFWLTILIFNLMAGGKLASVSPNSQPRQVFHFKVNIMSVTSWSCWTPSPHTEPELVPSADTQVLTRALCVFCCSCNTEYPKGNFPSWAPSFFGAWK